MRGEDLTTRYKRLMQRTTVSGDPAEFAAMAGKETE